MGPRQPPPLRPQRCTAINIKTGIWMFFQHWTTLISLGLETPTTKAKNLKTLFSKQNWNEKCKNGLTGILLCSVHCSIVHLRIDAESPDWKNVCSVLNKAFFEERDRLDEVQQGEKCPSSVTRCTARRWCALQGLPSAAWPPPQGLALSMLLSPNSWSKCLANAPLHPFIFYYYWVVPISISMLYFLQPNTVHQVFFSSCHPTFLLAFITSPLKKPCSQSPLPHLQLSLNPA